MLRGVSHELHRDAVVLFSEARLGKLQFQLRQDLDRLRQGVGVLAQTAGHLQQNAMNLRLLVFQQPHQIVVLLDGLQRLDENGLPAGRCAVGHALYASALLNFYGNDEALTANGDQFFLHRAAFRQPPQIGTQRFLNASLLLLDVAADTRQLG